MIYSFSPFHSMSEGCLYQGSWVEGASYSLHVGYENCI